MPDDRDPQAIVRLLQLTSPALPVGAYAYSGGLEHAVAAGWVQNQAQAREWITGVASHSLCALDLPVLCRMYRAWQAQRVSQVQWWNHFLAASRESAELLAEDRQLGGAMARLLADLGIAEARGDGALEAPCWAAMFSLAAWRWGIGETDMLRGYLWSWCENQVAAAIKLVPLGQTDGQRILSECAGHIPAWAEHGLHLEDEAIGQTAPALAMGSACHEQQYSRLFRS